MRKGANNMTSLRRTQFTREERLTLLESGKDQKTGLYRDANNPNKLCSLKETDLGHIKGYEERALRNQAQKLGMSQARFDDMIKHSEKYTSNGKSIFQAEYSKNNRSHKYECWDNLISRHNARELISNYKKAEKEGRTDLMMKEKAKQEKKQEPEKKKKELRVIPEKKQQDQKTKQQDPKPKTSIGNKKSVKLKTNAKGKEQGKGKAKNTKTAAVNTRTGIRSGRSSGKTGSGRGFGGIGSGRGAGKGSIGGKGGGGGHGSGGHGGDGHGGGGHGGGGHGGGK